MRSELMVQANGVPLCVETFGDRGDRAILLIMGRAGSMDWWEDELCERLADGGRFVVRYDQRDTGRSVSYEVGAPAYTGGDLAADAVGLLDALGVSDAHLVGISSGGALAQIIALSDPGRVASLTLIATTFAVGDVRDLPSMSDQALSRFQTPAPDWSDRESAIDYMVDQCRAAAGSAGFDEREFRAVASRAFDRSSSIEASYTNHDLIGSSEPPSGSLEDLDVAALIIHGTEDPVFPLEHGRALAAAIPRSELLALDGTGHELPRHSWDRVVPAILAHTSR
jgi:pimeloyl-ACP methyl ester carboxylesterase